MFCILLIPRQVPSRARMVETFAAAGDGSNSVTRQKFWLWSHGPKSQHFLQVLPPSAAIENQSWGLLPSAAWHWSAPWRPKRIWIVVGFKPCCLAEACATSVRWMRELKGFSNHRIFSQSYLVVFSCAMLCYVVLNLCKQYEMPSFQDRYVSKPGISFAGSSPKCSMFIIFQRTPSNFGFCFTSTETARKCSKHALQTSRSSHHQGHSSRSRQSHICPWLPQHGVLF